MEILIAFLLKMVDNTLGTFKTISLNKEKYYSASIFNAVGTFFYLLAVVRMTRSDNIWGIVAMCIATFFGTLLPGLFVKSSEKDKLYIFDITADSMESGMKFADELRELNIAVRTAITYDKIMNRTLACKVYCNSKEESRLVNSLIRPEFRYNVYVPISES